MRSLWPTPLPRPVLLALGLATALWLGGCASVIRLENDVQSYPHWTATERPVAGDSFRFERLPSQRHDRPEQAQLEARVAERLQAAGLAPVPANGAPRWMVEVSARSLRLPHAPWDDPYDRWPGPGLAGRDYVVTGSGRLVWMPAFPRLAPPYYQRELSVVVRDSRNGRAVFESRAAHDGPWADGPALWDALVQAALDGFPQPPSGPRRVVVEVPR